MSVEDAARYFVVPLSIQREANEYLVGNADIDEFYQFPEEGLRIIEHLQRNESVADIKAACASEFNEEIDVDAFLEVLIDAGFIYRHEDKALFNSRIAAAKGDGRIRLHPSRKLANAVFSRWSLAVYLAIVGYALVSAIQDPRLRLNLQAFYLEDDFTLILVSLLVLYTCTVVVHESGHILAAARHGIASRLGFGNRLWTIVAEADLTGILTLPKSQRYLPLLAGMLADVLTIALLTILLKVMLARGIDGFVFYLIQALILQVVVTLSWQFNVFLRTDLYYVLCNYYSYPNLDGEARTYLRDRIFQLSKGRFGSRAESNTYYNPSVLRKFTAFWIIGRVLAVLFLFLVLLPTLWLYVKDAYSAFRMPSSDGPSAIDLSMFALISIALFSIGMFMWSRRK